METTFCHPGHDPGQSDKTRMIREVEDKEDSIIRDAAMGAMPNSRLYISFRISGRTKAAKFC